MASSRFFKKSSFGMDFCQKTVEGKNCGNRGLENLDSRQRDNNFAKVVSLKFCLEPYPPNHSTFREFHKICYLVY